MLIFAAIDFAEMIDISCSLDLPPKMSATVIRGMSSLMKVGKVTVILVKKMLC